MTSSGHTAGQLYDIASNILQQRLSQLPGIGEVDVSGSALPAVRVEINPTAIFHYGVGLEDIRAALASANANSPKGAIEDDNAHYQIYANDQATKAAQYRDLVIAYRNGAAVKLSDVAEVTDSVEDLRNAGLVNGKPGVAVVLSRQPGANIIEAIDNVRAELPRLAASLPGDVDLKVVVDRSKTIRQSLADTEKTLIIAVVLVILVVFAFLRSVRAAAIPSVAVPTSIVGSFGAMYLLGFSLDNLSLMALTISTGFVVDDAIVVLENISRYLEEGMPRLQAAIKGANEVGFTVLSISLSLIAVFAPLIFFGGIVGRLFNEFAVTLSVAVMISLVVSLTTTPMMCALILPRKPIARHGRLYRATEHVFDAMLAFYRRTLRIVLRHPGAVLLSLLATVGLNYYMFRYQMTYGLFPVQDTGLIIGSIQGDQSISFQSMQQKLKQLQTIVQDDPAVASVVGFTGGRQTNSGFVYLSLKPFSERRITADDVVNRLRGKLAKVAGARLYMVAVSDLRTGGRQSNATYQYTLLSDDTSELYKWAPKLTEALMNNDVIKDVNSDQQQGGLETDIAIDRDTAMRLGLTLYSIDNTLYDAFGQRQVSVIYAAQNQYHVVMEVAPRYWQDPRTLDELYVSTAGANPTGTQQTGIAAGLFKSTTGAASTAATIAADAARNLATNSLAASGHTTASSGAAVSTSLETMVPLSAFARFSPGHTPLSVNHQGLFAASTISFNLAPGRALSEAKTEIDKAIQRIGMPSTVRGDFAGTAATAQAARILHLLQAPFPRKTRNSLLFPCSQGIRPPPQRAVGGRVSHFSRPGLGLDRPRPERLLHALGDLAQKGIARLAAGAAGVEVALKAVALRPVLRQKLEARLLDDFDRPAELGLRAADLGQHDDEAPLGAPPRELARQVQGRPEVVLRHAGRQVHDVGILCDLGRQIVGEAARVGDDEIDRAIVLAQFLEALEGAGVDLGRNAGAHAQRAPFDAGQLIEVEIGEQRLAAAMDCADRQHPRQGAFSHPALLADESRRGRNFAHGSSPSAAGEADQALGRGRAA